MIKVYEIVMSMTDGFKERNMEAEINARIVKEEINQDDIISFSWKNPRTINLFVKQ